MTELSTLTTDYLLAAFAATLGVLLLRQTRQLAGRLWAWALIALSLAALAGGTWHGFQLWFGEPALFWIWKANVYLIGVFGLAAVCGSTIALSSGGVRAVLIAAMAGITAVYGVVMTTHDDFIYVIYFSAAAMAVLLAVHLVGWFRMGDAASPWFIAGVVVSLMAAVVQARGVVLHAHFNNNDLFHAIQMVGLWLFFRGAQRLDEPRRG